MNEEKDVKDIRKMYSEMNKGDFPEKMILEMDKETDLRYGENPNQPGAIYTLTGTTLSELTNLQLLKSGKQGVSATNEMDVTRAMDILKFFDKPSVAVMKHLIPSGFATKFENDELFETYKKARDTDARSAFGSVVVFNTKVDVKTAEEIMSTFVEGVAAPEYEKDALDLFNEKKNIRVMTFSNLDKIPKFVGDETPVYDIRMMPTGRILVQKPYLSSIKSVEDLIIQPMIEKEKEKYVVKRIPTKKELDDLFTAWYINLGVRSNGIVIVKDGVTLAVGSGQQERVGAVEQAVQKAYQKAMDREGIEYNSEKIMSEKENLSSNPLEGAVLSSDGFFPFRDSIDFFAEHGIKTVIQPGGSRNDYQLIEAANEHNMSMVLTGERCFGHF